MKDEIVYTNLRETLRETCTKHNTLLHLTKKTKQIKNKNCQFNFSNQNLKEDNFYRRDNFKNV